MSPEEAAAPFIPYKRAGHSSVSLQLARLLPNDLCLANLTRDLNLKPKAVRYAEDGLLWLCAGSVSPPRPGRQPTRIASKRGDETNAWSRA